MNPFSFNPPWFDKGEYLAPIRSVVESGGVVVKPILLLKSDYSVISYTDYDDPIDEKHILSRDYCIAKLKET